jgi:hypothetical protein
MGKVIAKTRTATILLAAAALGAGLTVTACQSAGLPVAQAGPNSNGQASQASQAGQAGQAGQNTADQTGEDPGCQAIASQISSIGNQLSATSGDYSAQVPVLQTWYGDLQAAQQESQSGVVAGAIGDTAAGLEDVIVDEQDLMDDPSTGFSQLDSDDSNYQADVSNLETACGFSS